VNTQKRRTGQSHLQKPQKGILKPANSPWAAPVIFAGKKYGNLQLWMDY
jgi:hypothetical protein